MDSKSFSDADDSTVCTAFTPPETVITEHREEIDPLDNGGSTPNPTPSSSVPWPGSTFIIRSLSTGEVITLLDGRVVLSRPGGPGSIHWACVETKGWLGFQNITSGNFLGHNIHGNLVCDARNHNGWENFCARIKPEGGYVLLMTHWERLWQVGAFGDRLAKVGQGENVVPWEFVKV